MARSIRTIGDQIAIAFIEMSREADVSLDSGYCRTRDGISSRLRAHRLSRREIAQGYRYPGIWIQIDWSDKRSPDLGEVARPGGACGGCGEGRRGTSFCPLVLSLVCRPITGD